MNGVDDAAANLIPVTIAAPAQAPAAAAPLEDVIASLTEALRCLQGTAQSVSFLNDILATQCHQQEQQQAATGSRPCSAASKNPDPSKLQQTALVPLDQRDTAPPGHTSPRTTPTPAIATASSPSCGNAHQGNAQPYDTTTTTTSQWFIDALLSNGVKEQGVQSAMGCIRAALAQLSQLVASAEVAASSMAAQQLLGLDVAPQVRLTDDSGARSGATSAQQQPLRSPTTQLGVVVSPAATASPSRAASMRGGGCGMTAGSHTGSFLGASVFRQKGQKKDFADVDDTDVAQWLNENFAHASKRETNGFELQLDGGQEVSMVISEHRGSVSSDGSVDAEEREYDGEGNTLRGAGGAGGETSPNATTSPTGDPSAEEESSGVKNDHDDTASRGAEAKARVSAATPTAEPAAAGSHAKTTTTKYTRSTQRSFPAACAHKRTLEMLDLVGCPFISDINSPEFDVFAAHNVHGTNLLMYVAMNVFAQYNFVRSLQMDVRTLYVFFETVRFFYRDENPYHNAIHASDVLQTTHVYLCVNDVKENFSDVELFALLFAAVVHDVGHLGIANAFLIKVRHPLARLYNDVSPLENSHAALAFAILCRPECNFFASSDVFTRRLYEDFHNLVIEALHGTDMRLHAEQTRSVEGILEDGIIEDHEVGKLLKAILHAADLSNPMKPLPIYFKWVDRVMAEFWQQGDEEKRRGMPISILCDRNGTNVAKSQMGFISFVVKPFVKELAPVLPSVWLQRLDENWAELGQLSPDVEKEREAQITSFAARPWVDVDETIHPSAVQVLREDVCACDSDPRILQPFEFHTHNMFRRMENTTSPQDDELGSVPSSDISPLGLQEHNPSIPPGGSPVPRSWSTVANASSTVSGEESAAAGPSADDEASTNVRADSTAPHEAQPRPEPIAPTAGAGRRSVDGPRASIVGFAESPLEASPGMGGASAVSASSSSSSFNKKRGANNKPGGGGRQHSISSSSHTRLAAHGAMSASDVDADSTAYHLHAVTVLTQTFADVLQQRSLPSAPSDTAAGGGCGADDAEGWGHWVRTIAALEHARLQVRERLIARCQRGERRPTVLLLGTALRDDACDAAELSLFSRCPDAAALLLKWMTATENEGGSEVSSTPFNQQQGGGDGAQQPFSNPPATTLAQAFLNQHHYDRLLDALSACHAPPAVTAGNMNKQGLTPLAAQIALAMQRGGGGSAAAIAAAPAFGSGVASSGGAWCSAVGSSNASGKRSKKRLLSFQAEPSLTTDGNVVAPPLDCSAPTHPQRDASSSVSSENIAAASAQLGGLVLSMTQALFVRGDHGKAQVPSPSAHNAATGTGLAGDAPLAPLSESGGGDGASSNQQQQKPVPSRVAPASSATTVVLPPIKHRNGATDGTRHHRAGVAASAMAMGSYLPTTFLIGRGHHQPPHSHNHSHNHAVGGASGVASGSSSRSPSALDYSSMSDPSGAASTSSLWTPAGRMSELYALRAKPLRRTVEVMPHPTWMRDMHNLSPQRVRGAARDAASLEEAALQRTLSQGTAATGAAQGAVEGEQDALSGPQRVATLVVDVVDVAPL